MPSRNGHHDTALQQYSSRKLWQLLSQQALQDEQQILAARRILSERGHFRPQAAWPAPH